MNSAEVRSRAREVAFIDDVLTNAAAATQFGWQGIHHTDAAQTAEQLRQLGIPL